MTTRRDVALSCLAAGTTAYFATAVSGTAEGLTDTSASRASNQLAAAMMAADKAKLDALLAKDLSFGHSNGLVQTKEEFMKAVLSGQEVFKTIQLTEHSSHVVGNDAINRHIFTSDLVLDGKPLSVRLGELQVWQKQAGNWRLIARQAFRI